MSPRVERLDDVRDEQMLRVSVAILMGVLGLPFATVAASGLFTMVNDSGGHKEVITDKLGASHKKKLEP